MLTVLIVIQDSGLLPTSYPSVAKDKIPRK